MVDHMDVDGHMCSASVHMCGEVSESELRLPELTFRRLPSVAV